MKVFRTLSLSMAEFQDFTRAAGGRLPAAPRSAPCMLLCMLLFLLLLIALPPPPLMLHGVPRGEDLGASSWLIEGQRCGHIELTIHLY